MMNLKTCWWCRWSHEGTGFWECNRSWVHLDLIPESIGLFSGYCLDDGFQAWDTSKTLAFEMMGAWTILLGLHGVDEVPCFLSSGGVRIFCQSRMCFGDPCVWYDS